MASPTSPSTCGSEIWDDVIDTLDEADAARYERRRKGSRKKRNARKGNRSGGSRDRGEDFGQNLDRVLSEITVEAGVKRIDDPVPDADVLYASLRAEGRRRSLSHAQLLEVVDKLEHSSAVRTFVSIESGQSFREAKLLQSLSEGQV